MKSCGESSDRADLPFLKGQARLTLKDTFSLLDEAGRCGADSSVTIKCINLHWANLRRPLPETARIQALSCPRCRHCDKKTHTDFAAL